MGRDLRLATEFQDLCWIFKRPRHVLCVRIKLLVPACLVFYSKEKFRKLFRFGYRVQFRYLWNQLQFTLTVYGIAISIFHLLANSALSARMKIFFCSTQEFVRKIWETGLDNDTLLKVTFQDRTSYSTRKIDSVYLYCCRVLLLCKSNWRGRRWNDWNIVGTDTVVANNNIICSGDELETQKCVVQEL